MTKKDIDVRQPKAFVAAVPIVALIASLISLIVFCGTDAVSTYSPVALLGATAIALVCACLSGTFSHSRLVEGMRLSAKQILPAVPLLICIAMVSTTWMLSGVVPVLIKAGITTLSPAWFLVSTCVLSALVSVLTGSSWTTIATIGVALIGVGDVMGYNPAWTAGAIISGAYFGDKISPLSDTTVVASSSVGVDLFTHIRYLMITTIPALLIALGVYLCVGFFSESRAVTEGSRLASTLEQTFNLTPWVLVIPGITFAMIAMRINTLITLATGSILGIAGIYIFQPQLAADLVWWRMLLTDTTFATECAQFNDLASTSGIMGMLPTISLVLCAMTFGGVMLGTGMLAAISSAVTRFLRSRTQIVGATLGSGIFFNACTADQYLSIIIGANMYRDVYDNFGLEKRLLSRSLEDSVSVTSVLIPWNSCGVTQAAVLGVPTLVYLPFCVFNYTSPLMSLLIARLGLGIRRAPVQVPA